MKAVVKNIELEKWVTDKNHTDRFTMDFMVGKEFEFENAFGRTWFVSKSKNIDYDGYNFHKSWLDFVK